MAKVRRSPPEKKQLSLARDRRNDYGENAKSSRKNIPRAKTRANRVERHEQATKLRDAYRAVDEDQLAAAELRVRTTKPRWWRKYPDEPLGVVLAHKMKSRRER